MHPTEEFLENAHAHGVPEKKCNFAFFRESHRGKMLNCIFRGVGKVRPRTRLYYSPSQYNEKYLTRRTDGKRPDVLGKKPCMYYQLDTSEMVGKIICIDLKIQIIFFAFLT